MSLGEGFLDDCELNDLSRIQLASLILFVRQFHLFSYL